ncbi:MAG TPA: fasciclin domain-containing protein [Bacteroidales bacterium]|nr:fasciclin domain-containing protein [Bacteroidales bacterium]
MTKIAACMIALLFFGCQDEYLSHYERSANLPDQNLFEKINKDSQLSKFAKMIKVAGLDSLLSANQTFTVWAPVNDCLTDLDPDTLDKSQANWMVKNYVARFNNSSSNGNGKPVRMINDKMYAFTLEGTVFGGSPLLQNDLLAKNGILHTIGTKIQYHNNVYEYIFSSGKNAKLSAFILAFEEKRFNEALSTPIDIDNNGRTVYDSVTTSYNRLFDDNLGSIHREDSVFTMLIPSDTAWKDAYTRLAPYFKTYSANTELADSIQRVQTSLAIINNLIYKEVIDVTNHPDSIISTLGSVIHDPDALFDGSVKQIASNGMVYLTDKLNYQANETWNKPIELECEATEGRVAGPNTGINTRTVTSESSVPVSESRYIEVVPNTTTAQPAVTFDVPNVLSGKYDIYVEFVPASLDGTPRDSTKLLFDLTYMTPTGKTTNTTAKLSSFVTSGTRKVKMKAYSGFEFPISNYYDRLWWVDYRAGLHNYNEYVVTTKLMVKTNVTTTELNNNLYTRKFRIDRLIFEPVSN